MKQTKALTNLNDFVIKSNNRNICDESRFHLHFHNDESCQIYEARPLIGRKYGVLDDLTDCPLLPNVPLSEQNVNTAGGTFLFVLPGTDKKFYVGGHPLVYWIEHTEDGYPTSEKMKKLYKAAFSEDGRQFARMLLL